MNSTKRFVLGFIAGFKAFGWKVNLIVNTVLLGIVYFLVIGPVSVVQRKRSKKFLDLGAETKQSYWIEKNLGKNSAEYYHRTW